MRAWLMAPFYLFRSALVSTMTLAVSLVVLYALSYLLGLLPEVASPTGYVLGAELGQPRQEGLSGIVQVAVVAAGLWWLPGARLVRRGTECAVETVAARPVARMVLGGILLAVATAVLASFMSGNLTMLPGTSVLEFLAELSGGR